MLLRLRVSGTVPAGATPALLAGCSPSPCGRVHINTTHPGIGGTPLPAIAPSRYSLGVLPISSRKRALKEPRLENPTRKQISVTDRLAVRRRALARSIRRRVRYARGVSP